MFLSKRLIPSALRHYTTAARSATKSIMSARNLVVEAPETNITTLTSGLRVASESFRIPTATVGVWIDGGSRFETEKDNGVAHFLEHMNFKGTRKRTQYDLELEVENIGAHLNAYTSREQTVYFAKCFSKDVEQAVEILADILLNSTYGAREIEIERGVILREMEEIEQNLQEVVFDRLHDGAYRGCSLSTTILGPIKNIRSINRTDMINYIQTFYKGPRMVLCGAGGVDHAYLTSLAEKYFGDIKRGTDEVLQYEPGVFQQSHQIFDSDHMELVYGCLAVEGTSWTHPDNIAMQLFNTMMGQFDCSMGHGIGGSSLLTDAVLEHGISGVNSFMNFTTNYKDTGLTGVYFSLEAESLHKFTELVTEKWRSFLAGVDEERLNRAKRSLFTNMLLMLDGSTPICEDIGRQLLCYGRRMSTPELKARIDAITPDTIRRLAECYFSNRPFVYTVVGGRNGWPTEDQISRWLKV